MVPKEKKEKKRSEKENSDEKTKRRSSLVDSSSPSTSSTSSSVDSDENSSGTAESKSTMTSIDLPSCPTLPTDPSLYRTVCTDIPPNIGQDIGFTSLSNQFPLNNTQPSPPISDDSKKNKSSNKKKQDKRDKKEKKENTSLRNSLETSKMRTQDQHAMRREVAELLKLNPQQPTSPSSYSKGFPNTKKSDNQDKLAATIGFGIAATGIYDRIPEMTGCRQDKSVVFRGVTYSEYVGEKRVNWRSAYEETYIKEKEQYGQMKVDWEAVGAQRKKLKAIVNRLAKNKWIRDFLHLVLDGKIKKVWKRIEIVQRVLKEHEGEHPYRSMGSTAMLELVMQVLVQMLIEPDDGFNLLMYLVTHSFPECILNDKKEPPTAPCFHRNHSDCMLAELILSSLPPLSQRRLLAHCTTTTRRRAIHFAASAGNPCQLDVLLKFDVNTNYIDATGRAPIHYGLARNNVLMLRQLMWHGTDLSLFDPVRKKMPVDDVLDNYDVNYFLTDRLKALERAMSAWLKALCAGKWKLGSAVTALHCTRIAMYGDSVNQCLGMGAAYTRFGYGTKTNSRPRIVNLAMRDEQLANISKNPEHSVMLFALPVMFTPYDPIMPAIYPHVVRTKLVVDNDYLGTPAHVMCLDPQLKYTAGGVEQTHDLPSAFHEMHNGYIYAWQFPKNVDEQTSPTLTLPIDPSQLGGAMARHSLFFIQAYSVTNLFAKQKCE